MPAKKAKKEVVEEIDREEEVEEFIDNAEVLPKENDDTAYEEDLESEGEIGAEESAGEWVDE